MRVENKVQMYEMLKAGKFGNTARNWGSYRELVESGYRGLVGVRSLVPGGAFRAYTPFDQVKDEAAVYSEMQKDEGILLQGEVYRSVEGLYLFASKAKTHMRAALKEAGKHYWLSSALAEIQTVMWPTDYDCIHWLLTEYYDSVVEFSVYDIAVGTVPNRNTIIWEVRNY